MAKASQPEEPRPSADAASPRRPRAPGRRTHAERSAETRQRILAAVVECIHEVGFQRTTASEIAARSGLTWGAVQHHFGGKDGILEAVLEDSFRRFVERFADLDEGTALPLEKRVDAFVDRAWEHYGSLHYRSTFEILLNHAPHTETAAQTGTAPLPRAARAARSDDEGRDEPWQLRMFSAWDGVFIRVFGDLGLAKNRRRQIASSLLAALTGLATIAMLQPDGGATHPEAIATLKRHLLADLEAAVA